MLVDVAGIEPAFEIATANLSVLKSHLPFHALMRGTSRGPVLTSIMLYPRF